ncbi:uncharacterized protein V1518DRAFT_158198 [Limtongia smithiae]|uniref:uncharacterized protein n=1 Tax=Limtongia smithiae TaxID=1125753 RepID=UPI0034CFACB2
MPRLPFMYDRANFPLPATTPAPVEESGAFVSQLDEVERALENLMKSGKFYPTRRDGMPLMSSTMSHGNAASLDPRMPQSIPRPPFNSIASDPEVMRSQPIAGLNNYYATQRYQPSPVPHARTSDAEVIQMKRRMAALRERELRNFHQEQQLNRAMSPDTARKGGFPQIANVAMPPADLNQFGNVMLSKERVMSPSALSDDDRRELASRQQRAFYGLNSEPIDEQNFLRSAPLEPRGVSPRLAFDPFQQPSQQQLLQQPQHHQMQMHAQAQHMKQQFHASQNTHMQLPQLQAPQQQQQVQQNSRMTDSTSPIDSSRTASNGTSSPSSRSANFSLFDSSNTQQSNTSTSSPDHSPPPRAPLVRANTTSSVAPIGTRPVGAGSGMSTGMGMRPIASPFSIGSDSDPFGHHLPERTASAASNLSEHDAVLSQFDLSSTSNTSPSLNGNNSNINMSSASTPTSSASSMAWSSKVWGNKGLGMAASVWG